MKRHTYIVWAHGVRIKAIDISKQEEAIAIIREANQRLHPGLDLVRVAWTMRTLKQGKPYGSLIIDTGSIEIANRLITQGLAHKGEIKYYDRFIKEVRVTQCI